MNNQIIRVFPTKTSHTPNDDKVFIGDPPFSSFIPKADEAHVSVVFSWDRAEGERLARAWGEYLPTKLGGPAFNSLANDFIPGRYLKKGYTITSRGCSRNCWFCRVPEMEGDITPIKIKDGWKVQDNNFLATPHEHQIKVFNMLRNQTRYVSFPGGLDIRLFTGATNEQLKTLKIKELFFAFDNANLAKKLSIVGQMLCWLKRRKKRCYVLVGYAGDNLKSAEDRLNFVWDCGFLPFAMFYQEDKKLKPDKQWQALVRKWRRPAIMFSNRAVALAAIQRWKEGGRWNQKTD